MLNIKDLSKIKYFDYPEYINRKGEQIEAPENPTYKVGDILYQLEHDNLTVVLGCIDEESEELRGNMDGMVCFCDVRPATTYDMAMCMYNSPTIIKEYLKQIS